MKTIFSYLCHFGNTIFFMYQRKYSKDWDIELNRVLDNLQDAEVVYNELSKDYLTLTLNKNKENYTVWIGNKYYSFAYLWAKPDKWTSDQEQFRPKFSTMLRLESLVVHLMTTKDKKYDRS